VTKYNNSKIDYEGEKFDSKFELDTYIQLIRLFDPSQIDRQVKINLQPKTEYFGATNLILDFGIKCTPESDKYICFVETKGFLTPECKIKLKWLSAVKPGLFQGINFVVKNYDNNLPRGLPQILLGILEVQQSSGALIKPPKNLFRLIK
jgi:hypothetical protein